MQATPMMMKGTESSWPMLNSMPDSKSTCMSFVYSMKKRNVKMSVSTRPKKKPLPTGLVESSFPASL